MKKNLKKALNASWKVSLTIVGIFALLLIVKMVDCRFGRAKWYDKTLSSDVVVRAYKNDTWRVYNKRTGKYTTPKVCWVAGTPDRDSLTVFCDRKGYRGFLNVNTGEIVISAQYGKAWMFSEGLAAVEYGQKKLGFINHDNEMVMSDIPHEPGYFDYLFIDGFCVVETWQDGESIYSVYSSRILGKVGDYYSITHLDKDGYMIGWDKDGYWLLDKDYDRVFAEPYDDMEQAYAMDGVFATRNWLKQHIDFDGTVLEPFLIDYTSTLSYVSGISPEHYDEDGCYHEQTDIIEFEPDLVVYHVNEYQGLMNARTGKIITPAKYGMIRMISKELLRAEVNIHNDECVVLDRNGKVVKL